MGDKDVRGVPGNLQLSSKGLIAILKKGLQLNHHHPTVAGNVPNEDNHKVIPTDAGRDSGIR